MKNKLVKDILESQHFEKGLIEEIITTGRSKSIPKDTNVISPGMATSEIPLVLNGSIKVLRNDHDGHEIFLYYLNKGETCAMSITCCMENKASEFSAITEEDSMIWFIPMQLVNSWVEKYPTFRQYIFRAYQSRFDELLSAIDSVTFMKMDERLYKYLLDKKQASGTFEINKTHQQIAQELNTSRVVISRLLKKLESEDKIEQHRNKIEIL